MSDETELIFSLGFAARVLGEADRIVARRRRWRLAALGATAAASTALLVWGIVPDATPATPPAAVPQLVDLQLPSPGSRSDEPNAFGYLFPDAEPVARFAEEYSDANGPRTSLLAEKDPGAP